MLFGGEASVTFVVGPVVVASPVDNGRVAVIVGRAALACALGRGGVDGSAGRGSTGLTWHSAPMPADPRAQPFASPEFRRFWATYLVSAVTVATLGTREQARGGAGAAPHLGREIKEGVRWHLSPFQFGVVTGLAGVGALVGATLAASVGRAIGTGGAIAISSSVSSLGVVVMVTMRSFNRAVVVVVAPLAGLLADQYGLRPALLGAAAVFAVAVAVLVTGLPLRATEAAGPG